LDGLLCRGPSRLRLGHKRWSDFAAHDVNGFIGGGQLGVNYQTGAWVLGVEADLSSSDIDGSNTNDACALGPLGTCQTDVDWVATATVSAGPAWDRAVIYVKGGAAWARDKYRLSEPGAGVTGSGSETKFGWTAGVGVEYALAANWSAKLEYSYLDFGTDNVRFNTVLGSSINEIEQHVHVVKFGINYRFATGKYPVGKTPAPVVTKY
jgi:outer membrane immunogenic protein